MKIAERDGVRLFLENGTYSFALNPDLPDDYIHAQIDSLDESALFYDYQLILAAPLAFASTSSKVLILGVAAGASLSNAKLITEHVVGIELNPHVIDLACEYTGFNHRASVIIEDALEFVKQADADDWYLVQVDLIDKTSPRKLYDWTFYRGLNRICKSSTWFAVNMSSQSPADKMYHIYSLVSVFGHRRLALIQLGGDCVVYVLPENTTLQSFDWSRLQQLEDKTDLDFTSVATALE